MNAQQKYSMAIVRRTAGNNFADLPQPQFPVVHPLPNRFVADRRSHRGKSFRKSFWRKIGEHNLAAGARTDGRSHGRRQHRLIRRAKQLGRSTQERLASPIGQLQRELTTCVSPSPTGHGDLHTPQSPDPVRRRDQIDESGSAPIVRARRHKIYSR